MMNADEQQYEECSSEQIIGEFRQADLNLLNSRLEGNLLVGEFGVAEMHLKKGDSIIIYDPVSNKLKVIKEIYRTHLIKSNKRKPNKKSLNEPEDKQVRQNDLKELAEDSASLISESSEQIPQPTIRPKKTNPLRSLTKGILKRKLRKLIKSRS